MLLSPIRAIGVSDLGVAVAFLVSFGAAGAAPEPAGREGHPPPCA